MRSTVVNVGVNAREQVMSTVNRVRRVSPAVALIRIGAAVATFVALLTALPFDLILHSAPSVLLRVMLAVAVASAAVGLYPRTRWVSLVAVGTIVAWLISTIVAGDEVSLARVGLLAAALYVMHATAAFAAALPYDCVVEPVVLLRWLGRMSSLLAVSLAVGLGAMALGGALPAVRSVVGPIVGSVIAAGLAGLLAWHLRRRG